MFIYHVYRIGGAIDVQCFVLIELIGSTPRLLVPAFLLQFLRSQEKLLSHAADVTGSVTPVYIKQHIYT